MDNPIIYNRENRMLELSNHIDQDGELDSQYALLRNLALTGKYIDGKFVSSNPKHFKWLKECATTEKTSRINGSKFNRASCSICSKIFVDVKSNNFNISKYYKENVVKLDERVELPHPLFQQIMERFNGIEIK